MQDLRVRGPAVIMLNSRREFRHLACKIPLESM